MKMTKSTQTDKLLDCLSFVFIFYSSLHGGSVELKHKGLAVYRRDDDDRMKGCTDKIKKGNK